MKVRQTSPVMIHLLHLPTLYCSHSCSLCSSSRAGGALSALLKGNLVNKLRKEKCFSISSPPHTLLSLCFIKVQCVGKSLHKCMKRNQWTHVVEHGSLCCWKRRLSFALVDAQHAQLNTKWFFFAWAQELHTCSCCTWAPLSFKMNINWAAAVALQLHIRSLLWHKSKKKKKSDHTHLLSFPRTSWKLSGRLVQ